MAAGYLANDDISNQLNYTIVDSYIHPDFHNVERHDIALIKVGERLNGAVSIPSGVQDSATPNCSLIIRNHGPSADYFQLVTNIRIAPDSLCASSVVGGTAVDDDDYYCSQYPMGDNWCDLTIDQVRNSGDLGSALICNNIFMGLLSEIQFPYDQFTFPCSAPRMTFALYTSIDDHKNWLYMVMGRPSIIPTDPDDILEGDQDNGTMRQTAGIIMITLAIFIYYFL